ncbi:hypothetical protein M0813_06285 [Anaeramoeba flamelloides]|uniref:Uncharacterized protein n=1 Tax=Anaeramoeba flamelloides TaxID=1746091 RepID=A0AAV7YDE8_9EUKA|nr:hypothetical protein M0812_25476 [Anaeramoeba flamelloides]KAJ6230906.1 hypothetical protein M0813_06285 [Anaeramoeba flamelloides]
MTNEIQTKQNSSTEDEIKKETKTNLSENEEIQELQKELNVLIDITEYDKKQYQGEISNLQNQLERRKTALENSNSLGSKILQANNEFKTQNSELLKELDSLENEINQLTLQNHELKNELVTVSNSTLEELGIPNNDTSDPESNEKTIESIKKIPSSPKKNKKKHRFRLKSFRKKK